MENRPWLLEATKKDQDNEEMCRLPLGHEICPGLEDNRGPHNILGREAAGLYEANVPLPLTSTLRQSYDNPCRNLMPLLRQHIVNANVIPDLRQPNANLYADAQKDRMISADVIASPYAKARGGQEVERGQYYGGIDMESAQGQVNPKKSGKKSAKKAQQSGGQQRTGQKGQQHNGQH